MGPIVCRMMGQTAAERRTIDGVEEMDPFVWAKDGVLEGGNSKKTLYSNRPLTILHNQEVIAQHKVPGSLPVCQQPQITRREVEEAKAAISPINFMADAQSTEGSLAAEEDSIHAGRAVTQESQITEEDDEHMDMVDFSVEHDRYTEDRLAGRAERISQLYNQTDLSRVFILGTGKLARFVAQSLATARPPTPITVLPQCWPPAQHLGVGKLAPKTCITELSRFPSEAGFQHTLSAPFENRGVRIIDKLIITTKACFTSSALLSIKARIRPTSTICFLQHGMGIVDEVNKIVFPNPATRPRYVVGSAPHDAGNLRGGSFKAVCDRSGGICLSLVPKDSHTSNEQDHINRGRNEEKPLVQRMYYGWTASSRSLLRSLTRVPTLEAKGFRYEDILRIQLERLAIDAVVGPLSVVFNCENGKLLSNLAVTRLMREILREIVTVTWALPELRDDRSIKERFTAQRLEHLAFQFAMRTSDKSSSMLKEIRAGRRTDIDFLNGYIVRRGLELGIRCPVNAAVMEIVKAKQVMRRDKGQSFVPFK